LRHAFSLLGHESVRTLSRGEHSSAPSYHVPDLCLFVKTVLSLSKLHILLTQCIHVFRMVLTINSDCFPKQH
jgi:hypothetical protein